MRCSPAALPAQVVAQPAPAPTVAPEPASLAARVERLGPSLDDIFARYMADQHVPGLVYGIVADGRLAYVQTMGRRTLDPYEIVTPDSLFRIASMSKAFTGQAGECRTDASVTATGALAGRFRWTCERGTVEGQILLAPTSPPTIQALRLRVAP